MDLCECYAAKSSIQGEIGLLAHPSFEWRQIGIWESSYWYSIVDVDCHGHSFGPEHMRHPSMLQHRPRWVNHCAIASLHNAILLP